MKMWQEIYANAKTLCARCRCCPVYGGLACRGGIPGPGEKGSGSASVRNAEMLKKILITMDMISDNMEIDTAPESLGHKVSFPVYAAPINGTLQNYSTGSGDMSYARASVDGCRHAGMLAFTGNGAHGKVSKDPVSMVAQHEGFGVPTIEPWSGEHMTWRIELAKEGHVLTIANGIDANGLTNLRASITPIGSRNVGGLKEITRVCGDVPFILKGIPNVKEARKTLEAGTSGITVSNHGGRALDNCLSGIEVLEGIVKTVDGHMKVFVNGASHTGNDVFKALALGVDGVLIGRPVPQAVTGDGSDGLVTYLERIRLELREAMAMAGRKTIQNITRDCVNVIL